MTTSGFLLAFAILEYLAVMLYVFRKVGEELDLGALSLGDIIHVRGRALFCMLLFNLWAVWPSAR